MRSIPPPAYGGLCRLKPAFQAYGAITQRAARAARRAATKAPWAASHT